MPEMAMPTLFVPISIGIRPRSCKDTEFIPTFVGRLSASLPAEVGTQAGIPIAFADPAATSANWWTGRTC